MFRLIPLLCLLPTYAAADWSPLPRAFDYTAVFDRCTIDPTRVDPDECATLFHDAFILNEAVANAVADCTAPSLAACDAQFEDIGLPAIAARIAVDSACEQTPAATFPPFTHLSPDHCITMISDILRDEGVVPLDAPLHSVGNCALRDLDCEDLHIIHGEYWYRAVIALSDTDLTRFRSDTEWNECMSTSPTDAAVYHCHAAALATIWADLSQAEQDN
jgi:hypothetical protein